ncbi:putative methyltransferase domain-containing protein [Neofusicoccum parvum]|nr:putative methyltransferase domain-containing protein [Neofusicoccum parvum]
MLETAPRSAADDWQAKDRTYHATSSPYALPNDAAEHRRLDDQNAAYLALMRGRLVHCALPSPPARILDVGAGSGATTLHLAAAFPSAAAVVGLDLSPVPALAPAPAGLPGVVGVQGDFLAPALADLPAAVRDGAFDLVFSRLLVMGVNDWGLFFERVREVLRPGTGWVETQELDQVWGGGEEGDGL